MVQLLKPSSFLPIAAAALSLPASSNAQDSIFSCILTSGIDLQAPLQEVAAGIDQKCCPEGTAEPTCTAFKCVDLETMFMKEPCTCGEVEEAQVGMLSDPTISGAISMMLPTFAEDTQAAFDACCPAKATTASEFNTCFAALQTTAPGTTTTATTAASTNVDDGSTSTESTPAASTTTEAATTTTTTTASTGAALFPFPSPSPSPSNSANSITSVSFNIILAAYALFNYAV